MSFNNECRFVGNLTRDPEVRTTASGKTVANFGLAVDTWKGPQEKGEPLYLDFEAWDQRADTVATLSKGQRVLVITDARLDSWEDKESGEKRSKIKFRLSDIFLAIPRTDREEKPAPDPTKGKRVPKPKPKPEPEPEDDEIPF